MDKAEMAGQVTGLGLLVVFACLIIIIGVIVLLSFILKERKKKPVEPAPTPAVQPAMAPAQSVEAGDEELIAVLTAAVAAAIGEGATAGGLVVRSYRRINHIPAWERAGKNEQIFNKF